MRAWQWRQHERRRGLGGGPRREAGVRPVPRTAVQSHVWRFIRVVLGAGIHVVRRYAEIGDHAVRRDDIGRKLLGEEADRAASAEGPALRQREGVISAVRAEVAERACCRCVDGGPCPAVA